MGETVPLAIAIAASPFPVIPAILLLFTPRPRATASAFLGGWILGIAAATGVFVLLADIIELADEPPAWASWTRVVLGAALLGWGLAQWFTRRAATKTPAWMATISSAGPRRAIGLALALSVANPKILLLAAAAGLAIGTSAGSDDYAWVAVASFTLLASLTVAAPLVLFLILGDRVLGPLGRARDWLQRNNAAVMAVVFVVIGIALLAKGLASL